MEKKEFVQFLNNEKEQLIGIIKDRARINCLSSEEMERLYNYDNIPFADSEDRENHMFDLGRLSFINELGSKIKKGFKCFVVIKTGEDILYAIIASNILNAFKKIHELLGFDNLWFNDVDFLEEIVDLDFHKYKLKGKNLTIDDLILIDSSSVYVVEKIL